MTTPRKAALITGAATGIGRAVALRLARHGLAVAVNYSRSEAEAWETAAEVEKLGVPALLCQADVADDAAVRDMVRRCQAEFGGLDVLVNNAGVGGPQKPLGEITAEEWDATVNINLRAVFFCMRYAVPALRAAKGNIVNVASILGLGGRGTGASLYCASKAGVVNLTRDIAIELAPDIRVNCVCPGAVDTEMLQELGRALGQGRPRIGVRGKLWRPAMPS